MQLAFPNVDGDFDIGFGQASDFKCSTNNVAQFSNVDRFDALLLRKEQLAKSNGYYRKIHPTEAAEVDARLAADKAKAEAKTRADAEAKAKAALAAKAATLAPPAATAVADPPTAPTPGPPTP